MMVYYEKYHKRVKFVKQLIGLTFFLVFAVLFYRQAIHYGNRYPSDLPAHIEFGIQGRGYSLLYFVIGFLFRVTNSYFAIALLESGILVSTWLLSDRFIAKHFNLDSGWRLFISTGLLFLCSIYIPGISSFFYKNSIITQPWHSITYFGMRLFTIPATSATLDVIERYKEKLSWKEWLKIAVPLTISTGIKPNFLIIYSFSLLIILIVDFVQELISKRLSLTVFWNFIFLGTVVFPSLFILLVQSQILYGAKSDSATTSGIALVFLSSSFFRYGAKTIIKVIQGLFFPVLVFFTANKITKKEKLTFLLFIVALIQVIVLKETGPRQNHGNFYWGVYSAAFLTFLYASALFVQKIQKTQWCQKTLHEKCIAILGISILTLHCLSGFVYFVILLLGGSYGI